MTVQYWQSKTSGETWAVQVSREDDGEVEGVCGPLHHAEMPGNADDGDWDFEVGSETCRYYQEHRDDFRMTTLSPEAR